MVQATVINNIILPCYTNYSTEYEKVIGMLLKLLSRYLIPLEL